MPYFHPQEEHQVWAVSAYEDTHPGARYRLVFGDGESYICEFDTMYNSGNWAELDALGVDDDDPRFDEFEELAFNIIEAAQTGSRRYNEYLTVDYRDFPVKITDADTGAVVYPAE